MWRRACFPVSLQDGTDINYLICKRQRLGIIILNSKVGLVLPSWAPAWCYPQASWGFKVPTGSASVPLRTCGHGIEATAATQLSTCGKLEVQRCSKYPCPTLNYGWPQPSLEPAFACTDLKLGHMK